MSYRPQKLGEMTLEVMGIEVTVRGAVYHPHVPATQIDPPESEFAEWGEVLVGDQDISELFQHKYNADRLHEAILQSVE